MINTWHINHLSFVNKARHAFSYDKRWKVHDEAAWRQRSGKHWEHTQVWWAAVALNRVPLLPTLQLFQRRSCCLQPWQLRVPPSPSLHILAALKGQPAPSTFTRVFFLPCRFAKLSAGKSELRNINVLPPK